MTKKASTPKKKSTKRSAKTVARAFVVQASKAKQVAHAAREKKLAGLIALVARRKARIVEDFYDIGEALRTIRDERLHEVRGLSFEQLVRETLELSPGTAYKLIAVVEHLPRERAIALGQEKSYALVTYAAATPEADTPAGLLDADAKVGGKPVSQASAADLRGAASSLKRRRAHPDRHARDTEEDRAIRAALAPLRLGKLEILRTAATVTIRITKR